LFSSLLDLFRAKKMSSIHISGEMDAIPERLLPLGQDFESHSKPELLTDRDSVEVLRFLSLRPLHTVFVAGLIRDNGFASTLNRGEFYGHRNEKGELDGVALIGEKNVIEAQDTNAFEALMTLALEHPRLQLIRGEERSIERLLSYLDRKRLAPRLICREQLFEQNVVAEGYEPVENLCPAAASDLEQVMAINSAMAFEENGTNPLKRDLRGMTERTRLRIERGRVWILAESGRIIFKADAISITPEVIFLEGVYVHPAERGRGVGSRCLAQLGRILLKRARSLTLIVNQEKMRVVSLYRRLNYQPRCPYLTVYF
jgi:uncharacterized protein